MLTEDGAGWSGREDLYTLGRLPLGVVCDFCGKRALLPIETLAARDGDMTPVKSFKVRCSCGSRHWKATIFASTFAAG
jgi:hypothetical protein